MFDNQNEDTLKMIDLSLPLGGLRDDYNRVLPAFTCEMAAVKRHLEIALRKVGKDSLESPFVVWDSVEEALSNANRVLKSVSHGFRERPPARLPGSVIPKDMCAKERRPPWGYGWKDHPETLDVVRTHYIPQSKRNHVCLNQIVPVDYLKQRGHQFRGENGAMLYSFGSNRKNERATLLLNEKTASVYGDAFFVPLPLETERWLASSYKPQCAREAIASLHNIAITRFTIDQRLDGSLLLSFATLRDQINAKMALG